jgi:hypothetical protein
MNTAVVYAIFMYEEESIFIVDSLVNTYFHLSFQVFWLTLCVQFFSSHGCQMFQPSYHP